MGVSSPQAGFSELPEQGRVSSESRVSWLWLFVRAPGLAAPQSAAPPSLTFIAFTLLEEGCTGLYLGQMVLLQTFYGGQGLTD